MSIKLGTKRCPLCKKPLLAGKMKRYETLIEHVMNPNQEEHPERPTLVCANKACQAWDRGYWSDLDYEKSWYSSCLNIPSLKGWEGK